MGKLTIAYRNGTTDEFDEKQIDCSKKTIKGHAADLIETWQKGTQGTEGIYAIDHYNAVLLREIICVRGT